MNNIKKFRRALNMSQEDLAKKLNVDRTTVVKWENGTFPRVSRLKCIATVLGCTVDDLLCSNQ